MLCGEATHTNLLIFGLTQLGLEPTIYRTRGEHANLQNINNSKSCPEVNLWFCTLSENATFFNVKLKDIGFVK
jgi:hypothetical protein